MHSLVSENSKDVNEEHDDIEVQHESPNDVIVHVNLYAGGLLSTSDQNGVDNQVDGVQESSEAAVNSVHKLSLDDERDDQKRDHTKADHEAHGSEELNWYFGVHGVDCKRNGDQGCGGSSLDDGGFVILSGKASDHPGLASGESEE